MISKGFSLFITICLFTLSSFAYTIDTVSLSLKQCERRFLDSNLSLLIAKTNIDIQKGYEIQAKVFDNPNISYSHNFYNAATGRFFAVTEQNQQGELAAEIQQLVRIAGKRKNQIKLAKYNTQLSEYQYYDLLRALKYQLHTDLSQIDLCISNASTYSQQITQLQLMIDAYKDQVQRGNVSEKELVRIQNNLLSLKSNERSNYEALLDAENDLKTLLKYRKNEWLVPALPEPRDIADEIRKIGIDSLNSIATTERYDLKAAKLGIDMSQVNYKLQRSLGVPDPTFNLAYDRFGSAFNNYLGLGVSIDIPAFNRNQGNVRAAKQAIKAAQYNADNAYNNLNNDVETALLKMLNITAMQKSFDTKYYGSFSKVSQGMLDLYKERKISLFEFLDFFDSYGEAKRNINQLKNDYRQGIYDLNYTLGRDVF